MMWKKVNSNDIKTEKFRQNTAICGTFLQGCTDMWPRGTNLETESYSFSEGVSAP